MQKALAKRGGRLEMVVQGEPTVCHGRQEVRMLWLLADPQLTGTAGSAGSVGEPWPFLQQVGRLERRRTPVRRGQAVGPTEVEVTYLITSCPAARATAEQVLQASRGHWGIENRLHWVRDVTWNEDRSQVRSGAAPEVLAACRNLAISLLRRQGCPNLAAALRTNAGRPGQAVRSFLSAVGN